MKQNITDLIQEGYQKSLLMVSQIYNKSKSKHSVLHYTTHVLLIAVIVCTQISGVMKIIHAQEIQREDLPQNTMQVKSILLPEDTKDIFAPASQEVEDIQSANTPPEEVATINENPEPVENYQDVGVCAYSSTKTYEEGAINWEPSSMQYQVMQTLHINEKGMYESADGFLAVALGSYYGPVGSKFRVTLDSGIVLKVIKADAKADEHVYNGCAHRVDGSVMEFVINVATAANYFPMVGGYVNGGNFNNHQEFVGGISKIEKLV